MCRKPAVTDIPRLTLAPTPAVVAAYALLGRSESETEHGPGDAELAALAGAANPDPCARVIATLAFDATSSDLPRARALTADVAGAAEQCGDERLHAELWIQDSRYRWEMPMIGPRGEAAIHQAQIAAAHVMQPELDAALAAQRLVVARQRNRWDEAFRLADTALADYRARGLPVRQVRAVIARNGLRLTRAEPRDLAAILDDVPAWRPVAIAHHQTALADKLESQAAQVRYARGDVATAHADLVRLWRSRPRAAQGRVSRRITGEVVDRRGRPVGGARVAAAANLLADAIGIDLPASLLNEAFDDDLETTASDAAGRFTIEGAPTTGVVAAELAGQRSPPAEIASHVRLVLEPTRTVTGKVELAGTPHTQVRIGIFSLGARTGKFITIAPIAPDGSFTVAGAPVTAFRISAVIGNEVSAHVESQIVPASQAAATDVRISLTPSTRSVDVIVRSTVAAPLGGAEVFAIAGKHRIASVDDIMTLETTNGSFATHVTDATAPPAERGQVRPGTSRRTSRTPDRAC